MFCRGPIGFCSTGDEYNRQGDETLVGIHIVVKMVDDILLWDEDYDDHLLHITEVLNSILRAQNYPQRREDEPGCHRCIILWVYHLQTKK